MKLNNLFCLLICIVAFDSCKEVPPSIDFTPVNTALLDTSYVSTSLPVAQDQVVYLEEFTGLMCVNCPQGHALSATILNDNPGKVIGMAVHSYFQDPPSYWENFEIQEGIDIDNYLGPVVAWPAAAINRKVFSGKIVQAGTAGWQSAVTSELGNTSKVNIEIVNNFELDNGILKTKITSTFLEDLSSENIHLSVILQEDGIVNYQKTSTGTDSSYVHEHILRDMFTPYNGISLSQSNTTGRVYEKEFSITIPTGWDMSKSYVVALIHADGANKEVFQIKKSAVL